jgi:nucleotide-binding universal stress UspA family protein
MSFQKINTVKIIHHILVPTDFSPCAANAYRFGLQLAEKWNATLHLIHVVTPDNQVSDLPVIAEMATKDKIDVAVQLLHDFKDLGLRDAKLGVEVKDEVKISLLPDAAISTVAEETKTDLIIIGTHQEHSGWEHVFGSYASTVVKQAKCHVLVVPEKSEYRGFHTVGIAIDLQETDPYHLWQACKLMEPFHAVLHCVHIEKEGESQQSKLRIEEMKDFFANNAIALQLNFHTIQETSVSTGLEGLATEWGLDLLVMPAPHRDFLGRLFHKSMTQQMALQAKLPLLVLR